MSRRTDPTTGSLLRTVCWWAAVTPLVCLAYVVVVLNVFPRTTSGSLGRSLVMPLVYPASVTVDVLHELGMSTHGGIEDWIPILTVTAIWWVFLGAAGGAIYHTVRRRRLARRFPGHCLKCGYNLRGLPEPRCPECGTPFDPSRLKKHEPPTGGDGDP